MFAIMIGFLGAVILGLFLVPALKRWKVGQRISVFVGENHRKKEGTPTMGGFIFIIPTLLATLFLLVTDRMSYTSNLGIVLVVFIGYAIIGFLDDYLSIKKKGNEGLTEFQKLVAQIIIALIFFYMYMKNGGQTALVVSTLGIHIEMGWVYGLFILFILVGASNAVNLTDGLDGLAGGLSAIAFISFSLISIVVGFDDMGIFTFILNGAINSFTVRNGVGEACWVLEVRHGVDELHLWRFECFSKARDIQAILTQGNGMERGRVLLEGLQRAKIARFFDHNAVTRIKGDLCDKVKRLLRTGGNQDIRWSHTKTVFFIAARSDEFAQLWNTCCERILEQFCAITLYGVRHGFAERFHRE